MREVSLHCGVARFGNAIERALVSEGFKPCRGARRQLLTDAPWGWVISKYVTAAITGAVLVSDNPCLEYRLDLLEQAPAALLSSVSLWDIVRMLERLEAGQINPRGVHAIP